jgi:tetratricopeptide (TPR) repeat protein
MAHNPGSFAVLLGRKLVLALSDYESPSDYNIELEARHVWPLRVSFVRFGLLLALAVAGVLVARPRPAWPAYAVAAGTLLALLVFYVADRYRLPAYPALALLAGAGIDGLWRKARARRSILAPVAAGLAAFALSAVAFTLPLRRGSDLLLAGAYRNLGATLAFRGDRPGAVAACQQAQAIYDRYAATLNRQERLTASELSGLLEGLSPRVDAVEAASALLRQADTAAAIQQLEAGINRNPTARDAYLLLGSLLGTRGEHARARSLFGDAVARFPNDLVLRYNLALAALNAGDHQTALTNAEAVLKQVPDHPWARKVVERARAGLR